MPKLFERALVLCKSESVYGTDPVPTVSANAIVTSVPELEFVEKTLERNNARVVFGQNDKLVVIEACKISFTTEIRAGNSRNTAPKIAPLLKACGMVESHTADQPYIYTASDSVDAPVSCTIYFYQDSILRKMTGCIGTVKLVASANEIVELQWEFHGFYNAASDATPGAPTFDTNDPIIFNSANLSNTDITSGNVDAFEFDLGNEVKMLPSAAAANGVGKYVVTQRKVVGSVSKELGTISELDPIAAWATRTIDNNEIEIDMGTTNTNQFVVNCAKVYLDKPKTVNKDGMLWTELPFSAQRNGYDSSVAAAIFQFQGAL